MPRGKHPNSLANLKSPITPGEVRNPLGVNRKRPWTETYNEVGERIFPEVLRVKLNAEIGEEVLEKGATWREANAVRRMMEATGIGGTSAAKEIVDRIEGKTSTFEEEKVDATQAHVYLVVGDDKRAGNARAVVGNVEITGGINKPKR
jgi:hypothetical protein